MEIRTIWSVGWLEPVIPEPGTTPPLRSPTRNGSPFQPPQEFGELVSTLLTGVCAFRNSDTSIRIQGGLMGVLPRRPVVSKKDHTRNRLGLQGRTWLGRRFGLRSSEEVICGCPWCWIAGVGVSWNSLNLAEIDASPHLLRPQYARLLRGQRHLVIDGYRRFAALEPLDRYTVEATKWGMSEVEMLVLSRSLRFSS